MATLNFGPEWLRNLTGNSLAAGASATAASSLSSSGGPGFGVSSILPNLSYSATRYKLAEHRYGREEMLALFVPSSDIPLELKDLSLIMCAKAQVPLALEPMSKEEQSLLLQCVNSSPMVRSMGRGTTSIRGGRGESDRGRGRGRGRDEDGLGKLRNRDIWDDRSGRGFDRGFSTYGSEDGSCGTSTRELCRSISTDSWRDSRQHPEDDEADFRKPDRDRWYDQKDRYGPKNWREPRGDHGDQHEFDDLRPGRPPTEAIRKIEYKRSRSSGSASMDEEAFQNALPEWSTTNPQEVEGVGTFDSSGAFLAIKEKSVEKPVSDAALSVVEKDAESKPFLSPLCSVSPKGNSNGSSSSASDMNRISSVRDRALINGLEVNSTAASSSTCSLSPVLAPSRAGAMATVSQQLLVDDVNNRTVDGSDCEQTAAVHRQNTAAVTQENSFSHVTAVTEGIVISSGSGLLMDPLQMPVTEQDLRNTTSDVVDFVSKWTADSEGKLLSNGPADDLLKVDFSNDVWFYRDPQGDVQGPFSNAEMSEWHRTGYFTMNLLVRRGFEGDFCRLGEMIKALGHLPFQPRPSVASSVFNQNPLAPLAPVVTGLNQQQQLQQKQEQLRKVQQQQLLLAIQQQQQGLQPQDYLRHLQIMHQQQLQQVQLQQQQQLHLQQHPQQHPQPRPPTLHIQDGFRVLLPPHDPLLGPTSSTLPIATIHPSALTNSGGLFAHMLQPPMSNPGGIVATVPPALNISTPTDIGISSKLDLEVPTTVEHIEKMQFLVLEKEREDRQLEELQRIERERLEERKRFEQQSKAEEERLIMEEMKQQKLEELRIMELERKRFEEERRRLEELQRQVEHDRLMMEEKLLAEVEQDRLMMEEKLLAEKLQSKQKLKEKKEERIKTEQLRLSKPEEQRLKLEEEKKEEEQRKEAELRNRQTELEAKQKAAAEAQRKAETEARQKAEAEAKQRTETEARQKPEAEAKQRTETESRQKEERNERKKQTQPPTKSAWSNDSCKANKKTSSTALTLSQIQEAERVELAEEKQRQLERQRVAAEAAAADQTKASSITWTVQRSQPVTKPVPSLLQIQQEQAKQLKEGGQIEKLHLLATKVAEAPFGGPPVWKSGAQPVQWNKNGNTWLAPEPVGKKKTAALPDNSSQFPALGAAAIGNPARKTSASKSEKIVSKSKKEEAVVQKLFEVTKVRDELTEWCEKILNGLHTSVDIPTLVDLLKDIESPHEVTEYVRMYLGESKQVRDFTQQFLEKRSKVQNSGKYQSEDNLWALKSPSVPAQLPSSASGKAQPQQLKPPAAAAAGGGQKPPAQEFGEKSKGKKKKKMQKLDSSILGFNVCADPDRTNIGEIDNV